MRQKKLAIMFTVFCMAMNCMAGAIVCTAADGEETEAEYAEEQSEEGQEGRSGEGLEECPEGNIEERLGELSEGRSGEAPAERSEEDMAERLGEASEEGSEGKNNFAGAGQMSQAGENAAGRQGAQQGGTSEETDAEILAVIEEGQDEVMAMFDADGAGYSYGTWSAQDSAETQDAAAEALIEQGYNANMIRFETGTVLESGGSTEHMVSFNYAYKITAVRDWLYEQSK